MSEISSDLYSFFFQVISEMSKAKRISIQQKQLLKDQIISKEEKIINMLKAFTDKERLEN